MITETYYSTDYNILYNFANQRLTEHWLIQKIWTESKWKIFRYVITHYITFFKPNEKLVLQFDWGPAEEKQVTIPLTKEE